ncbi:8676_t:CDS:2, partial [Racocetra persica]
YRIPSLLSGKITRVIARVADYSVRNTISSPNTTKLILMNDQIKQLTRNYLDSLNLPSYQLDDSQKQKIIDINSQTEWIIFHSGSLTAQEKEYSDYDMGRYRLKEDEWEERDVLDRNDGGRDRNDMPLNPNYGLPTGRTEREIIKIYVGEEGVTVNVIIFMGGSGILGGRKQPAFDANYLSGRV